MYKSRGTKLFALLLFVAPLFMLPVGSAIAATAQATQIPQPEVTARAAIVVEYPSGRVLYQKSAHDRLAQASTTKIMTAILALEYGQLDEVVTISKDDLVGESSMGLREGEQQTLRELLYGMLLPSGNDAAMAVARTIGSKGLRPGETTADPVGRFVAMMNVRAGQLGLADTHFINPHGLDTDGHYSSAYDLASITWYAFHVAGFNEIVREVTHESPGHALLNTNELLTRYPGADGVKTGLTDNAGLCLVGSATRDGHRLISVVLNAPKWYVDSAAILDYGFARLQTGTVDATADVLSVTKRGMVSWLLANPPSLPPLPAPQPVAQGGGSAPVLAPANPVVRSAAPKEAALSSRPPDILDTTSKDLGSMAAVAMLFTATGGVALYFVATRLFKVRLRLPLRARRAPSAGTHQSRDTPNASLAHHAGRRREPNLLLSDEERLSIHLERAVALAWEGREGSSMAEFILALRCNAIDVVHVTRLYQVPPVGFLALARAQMALGLQEEAQRTLLHGCTVLPSERILRLALTQITSLL